MHKIEGALLQCVNNHHAKFEYKVMNTVGDIDYTNKAPPKHLGRKKRLSSTPVKKVKKIMKRAQNRRCTSSMCEQSLCKVCIYRIEYCWYFRLHKLGTPLAFMIEKMSKFNTRKKLEKNEMCTK